MRKKKLFWQIFPSYVLITLAALSAVTWYASKITRQFYIQQKTGDLKSRAHLIEDQVFRNLSLSHFSQIDSLCKTLGEKSEIRITVLLPDGKVIGDSEKDPAKMDNHQARPEIMEARRSLFGSSIRYSHTVKKNMIYVAIPKYDKDEVIGFLRLSVPLTFIDQVVNSIRKKIGLTGAIIASLAAVISLFVSWRIIRPVEEMIRGVEKFSEGDLSYRLPAPRIEEMNKLSGALNRMANQLDEKIQTIIQQRNEQKAVFQSMVEGVVAVDAKDRIISINKAAEQLFDTEPAHARGRIIQEVIRNSDLQNFFHKAFHSHGPIEEEIQLWDKEDRFLQVHGSALKNAQGEKIGALLVINDITRLRRLENLRRDFSSNVSHEISTPLTAIKGAVETLLDGPMEDNRTTRRFLEIIAKQTDRLSAIMKDLISLARLEREGEETKIILEEIAVRKTLESAVQMCSAKALEKNIKISIHCEEGVKARANSQILEQAVVNLVDNAIHYSDAEKAINISVTKSGDETAISVQDHGCGMEKEHLPRLFERFYRVDRARSRNLGGTGLGLAIVKHIAQVHAGRVSVESAVGVGSVFRIHLPNAKYRT